MERIIYAFHFFYYKLDNRQFFKNYDLLKYEFDNYFKKIDAFAHRNKLIYSFTSCIR